MRISAFYVTPIFYLAPKIQKGNKTMILLAKREKTTPCSAMSVIMKQNSVWFRTFLNIQDTKLNLKIITSDKIIAILSLY